MPKKEEVVYLPLDAFIRDDAGVVFGHPLQIPVSEEDRSHRPSRVLPVSLCPPLSFKASL